MKKILIYAFILIFITSFVSAQLAPSCDNYNITFQGVTAVNGDYKWTYIICQKDDPPIDYWVLESCICSDYLDEGDPVEACRNAGILLGYDSSQQGVTLEYGDYSEETGIIGFKFKEFDQDFECATFGIITSHSAQELQDVGLNASGLICTNYPQVHGPAHETITVPEFMTPAMALAILLTSPAIAYLLIKTRKTH